MINFLTSERKSELQNKYQVADYQLYALDRLISFVNLEGKRVLEIGGSNFPRELILRDLKCKTWVSVDVIYKSHYALQQQAKHYESEKIYSLEDAEKFLNSDQYLIFNGFAENISPIFYDYFDVVFSIASFEHITKLWTVIQKIYNSLKENGLMYSRFSPIWSSSVGHHCWVRSDINFNNLGKIPPFGHLLMRPFEMFNYLRSFYKLAVCEEIIYQIYFREKINRLFYEDYELLMLYSDFQRYQIQATNIHSVDKDILSKLKILYPNRERFDVYGLEIVSYK